VLVVDDNGTAREVLRSMLESFGFVVSTAVSGESALAELEAAFRRGRPYQLVFLDWKMEGWSGLETVTELRRSAVAPQPAIVLMSAWADAELASAAAEMGVPSVLEKPISPSSLFDAINEALGKGAGRAGTPPPQRAIRFTGGTVLLVEDNAINRMVAEEMLTLAGLQVTAVGSGREALEAVEREEFDVLLMDVQMPDMDGMETTRRLKSNPRHRPRPVIALTAHAMSGDRERFLAAGMDDYVTKPIDEETLLKVIARWVPGRVG
jgi:CheY-like chemotaxis protein